MAEKFQLKWNDFSSNVVRSFSSLRSDVDFSDVTLVSDDQKKIAAHKVVLSTCSAYFKNVLIDKNQPSSKVILCLENINENELVNVLDYIYNGEVKVFESDIERFLNIAQRFQLDGLIGNDSSDQKAQEEMKQDIQNYGNVGQDITEETTEIDVFDKKLAFSTQNQARNQSRIVVGTITSIEELDQQIRENLGRDEKGQHCCNICGVSSKKLCNMKEHLETHFEGLSFPCQQPQCTYVGRYRYNLRQHIHKQLPF